MTTAPGGQAEIYKRYLGYPDRTAPQAPWSNYPISTRPFMDAYADNNLALSSVVIRSVNSSQLIGIRAMLPMTHSFPGKVIEWTVFKFDDHLLDLQPEQTAPRFVTTRMHKNRTGMARWCKGLRMSIEHMGTPQGDLIFSGNVQQIANAVAITAEQNVIMALMNASRDLPDDALIPSFNGRRHMDAVIAHELHTWNAIAKDPSVIDAILAMNQKKLTMRFGKPGNIWRLPDGSFKMLNDSFKAHYDLAKGPLIIPDNFHLQFMARANKVLVVESEAYPQGEGRRPFDPQFADKWINHYMCINPEHYSADITSPDWKSEYADWEQFSHDSNRFERIRYETALRYAGLFHIVGTGPGFVAKNSKKRNTTTSLGDSVFRLHGAVSWGQWLKQGKGGRCLDTFIKALLNKPDAVNKFTAHFSDSITADSLSAPEIPVPASYFAEIPASAGPAPGTGPRPGASPAPGTGPRPGAGPVPGTRPRPGAGPAPGTGPGPSVQGAGISGAGTGPSIGSSGGGSGAPLGSSDRKEREVKDDQQAVRILANLDIAQRFLARCEAEMNGDSPRDQQLASWCVVALDDKLEATPEDKRSSTMIALLSRKLGLLMDNPAIDSLLRWDAAPNDTGIWSFRGMDANMRPVLVQTAQRSAWPSAPHLIGYLRTVGTPTPPSGDYKTAVSNEWDTVAATERVPAAGAYQPSVRAILGSNWEAALTGLKVARTPEDVTNALKNVQFGGPGVTFSVFAGKFLARVDSMQRDGNSAPLASLERLRRLVGSSTIDWASVEGPLRARDQAEFMEARPRDAVTYDDPEREYQDAERGIRNDEAMSLFKHLRKQPDAITAPILQWRRLYPTRSEAPLWVLLLSVDMAISKAVDQKMWPSTPAAVTRIASTMMLHYIYEATAVSNKENGQYIDAMLADAGAEIANTRLKYSIPDGDATPVECIREAAGAMMMRMESTMYHLFNSGKATRSRGRRAPLVGLEDKHATPIPHRLVDPIAGIIPARVNWRLNTTITSDNNTSEFTKATIEAVLMNMLIDYELPKFCIDNNLPPLIPLFVWRRVLVRTGSAIYMSGYGDAGVTFMGRTNIMAQGGVMHKEFVLNMHTYMRPVTLTPNAIEINNAIYCPEYICGNGVKFWDPLNPSHRLQFSNPGSGVTSPPGDFVVYALGPGEFIDTPHIDLTGTWDPSLGRPGADDEPPMISTGAIYAETWNISHADGAGNIFKENPASERLQLSTFAGRDAARFADGRPSTGSRGVYSIGVENLGHMGPQYDGCADVMSPFATKPYARRNVFGEPVV